LKTVLITSPHRQITSNTYIPAHPTDIFSIATTSACVITASGSSSLKIYSTLSSDFPLIQTLEGVHKLGCHHVAASANGRKAVSVGFGGEVKLWANEQEDGQGQWVEDGKLVGMLTRVFFSMRCREANVQNAESTKAGEIWAVALSEDGQYLTSTTHDGRINVWDLTAPDRPKIHQFETKGSFGTCIDMVRLPNPPLLRSLAPTNSPS
jgi:superkiller protein 8